MHKPRSLFPVTVSISIFTVLVVCVLNLALFAGAVWVVLKLLQHFGVI